MDLRRILNRIKGNHNYVFDKYKDDLCTNCGEIFSDHVPGVFECYWDNICKHKFNMSYSKFLKNYNLIFWRKNQEDSITFCFKPNV